MPAGCRYDAAMRLPEYDRLDATALAALVAAREVSPTDLVEAALLRIEARNPQLNAVVDVWADAARRAAAKPLPPGPLSGVPFLLKDVRAAVAGQLLSEGSRLLAGIRSDRDVEIVRRFRAAGMVAVGRTNAPEFALLPTTEPARWGPCRNPWDRARSSGGSSGGSAAAVAARMVPLGHGGDGGGSIRVPASACGVFGLKPTRGRVSLEPEREVWSGLSVEHVITRSVRDSARVLDLLAGPAPGDPAAPPPPSRPWSEAVLARPARLRVAFTSVPLLGGEVHPECRAAVEGAARLLAGVGHDVEEARPDLDAGALARAMVVVATRGVASDVAAASRRAGRRPGPEDLEIQTRGADVLGRALGDEELAAAVAAGARARATMDAFHARYDLLLTPTTPRPPAPLGDLSPGLGERAGLHALIAFPIRAMVRFAVDHFADGPLRVVANTVPFNFTGQPAASVPLHWSADGLPVGVQVVGRYGDEATVLAASAQLEAARPWADRAPPGI
jgi:amidase